MIQYTEMLNFVTVSVIFGFFCVHAQYIPIGVNKKPTCTYQFSVPDTKGACSATSAALEQKIDGLKQDLDRTRLQYVSQNGVVQGTLNQLQADTKLYVSKVSDLNTELQKIKQQLSSGQTGGSTNTATNQNLNQLIHDTKDLLTKAVGDINGRIFNLSIEFQRNAVEESKVNSAIQSQIVSQAAKLATAEQKLLSLENMIKNYKPPTSTSQPQPTNSGLSNAQLASLQQQYKKLEADLQTVDSLQQQQFRGLTDKTNKILTQLLNQTHDIDVVAQAMNQSMAKLSAAEQMIQKTKTDLDSFKKSTDPQLKILSMEANSLVSNLSTVDKQLQQLGAQIMSSRLSAFSNKKAIFGIKTDVGDLATKVAQLSQEIQAQSGELIAIKTDLSGFKPATGGGSININQLVNTIKNQTQADVQKAQKDVKQVSGMVQTLLMQVTNLSKQISKIQAQSG